MSIHVLPDTLRGLSVPHDFVPVQRHGLLTEGIDAADHDAFDRASEAADYPALHPDQFRFLLPVMLATHHRPVWCVATVGVDDRGNVAIDDAWIFLPARQAVRKHRGRDFDHVRAEAIGWHFDDLIARAAELRAPFRGSRRTAA